MAKLAGNTASIDIIPADLMPKYSSGGLQRKLLRREVQYAVSLESHASAILASQLGKTGQPRSAHADAVLTVDRQKEAAPTLVLDSLDSCLMMPILGFHLAGLLQDNMFSGIGR